MSNLKFGTDGIRGVFNKSLFPKDAYEIGNAVGRLYKRNNILLGYDTRNSSTVLSEAFCCGAQISGCNVDVVGVSTTPSISYLTKHNKKYNFGVVITASHNPAQYNGIKVFNSQGEKISNYFCKKIEKLSQHTFEIPQSKLGICRFDTKILIQYYNFLLSLNNHSKLKKIKIVLDCANGSSSKIAPYIFKKLGATVIPIFSQPNGLNINKKCGATNVKILRNTVKKFKADIGFAFDGDADRLIAVDELGQQVDGDQLLYFFATNIPNIKTVVGTQLTNTAIEKELEKLNIKLHRTKVGDKFIYEKLKKFNLCLGGEQSGHIILPKFSPTGDGLLNAIWITNILSQNPNKPFSSYFNFKLYPQKHININTTEQIKINEVFKLKNNIDKTIKIITRLSGTEPVLRIMIEAKNKKIIYTALKQLCLT